MFTVMRRWIGLAHVRPVPGNQSLGEAKGAHTPVVGLAKNAEDSVRA